MLVTFPSDSLKSAWMEVSGSLDIFHPKCLILSDRYTKEKHITDRIKSVLVKHERQELNIKAMSFFFFFK